VSVQAKVRCIGNGRPAWHSEDNDSARVARFTPVATSDPADPNYEWSQYTPSGYMELHVTNPDAFNKFEVGKEYLLTFEDTA
jgi:hypothetical protein